MLESEYPDAEIEIVTHSPKVTGVDRLAERFGVSLDRTRVRTVPTHTRSRFITSRPLRRFLHEKDVARISQEYDLFVNNTIYSVAPSRAPYSLYMCMFPLSPEPWEVRGRRMLSRLAAPYTLMRRLLYHRWVGSYSLVLANSEFTQDWIRKIWWLDSKVLYPPIETRSEIDLSPKVKHILGIGRFFPGDHNKKHDVLIEAFRGLRMQGLHDWQLHLVGGRTPVHGTDRYIERLRARAAGLPVFFHIDASKQELDGLLRRGSIFWHATGYGEKEDERPEKLEHFGISTVEAMSSGCVPVVYATGGQPEIIEQGESGFLWREVEQLQKHTLELTRAPAQREAMARRAHARSQRFSREAFQRSASALIQEVLNGTAKRSR